MGRLSSELAALVQKLVLEPPWLAALRNLWSILAVVLTTMVSETPRTALAYSSSFVCRVPLRTCQYRDIFFTQDGINLWVNES